jgi:LysM repeat protein
MNLQFSLTSLRRRTFMLVVVVALSIAMLPTAAFASGYGNQGRAYDPGPRQSRNYQRPNQQRPNHNQGNHSNRCAVTYKVKHGDTLSGIAKHFRVSLHQLAKDNGIKNPNRIVAGQVLCICR